MLIIKSFLKRPAKNIDNLAAVTRAPYDFFIDIDDAEEIKKISKQLNRDNLDGVLTIEYNGNYFLDFTAWDEIETLFFYFFNLLEELKKKDTAYLYFPSTSIKVELTRMPNHLVHVSFSNGKRTAFVIPEIEFVKTLLDEIHHFFTTGLANFNLTGTRYTLGLDHVKKLRAMYALDDA